MRASTQEAREEPGWRQGGEAEDHRGGHNRRREEHGGSRPCNEGDGEVEEHTGGEVQEACDAWGGGGGMFTQRPKTKVQ